MAENSTSVTEKKEKPASQPEKTETTGSKSSPAQKARPAPAKSTVKRGRTAGILALMLLVVLAGIAGGGYWGWQWLQQSLSALDQQNQQLARELETATAQLRQFESMAERTDDQWRSAIDDLETLVVESAQRWNAQSDRTENRWPLEEALTLTRLAAQRLQLDADAGIAVRMLQSADVILAQMDQAAVLPLRRQLAQDILALQSTVSADVNGIFFKLDAVSDQVRELSWAPKPQTQEPVPDSADPASGFWHGLKNVVVISRLDVPMAAPALQSDFERWRQHTLMLIEQTQLALLAGNQRLYDTALQQTVEQIEQMQSQVRLNGIQATLAEVTGAVLNPQWPDIDASIEAIEDYLAGPADDSAQDEAATAEEGSE
ncbi:uroporphyrinogen-III C-methyltransferase [Reinekea blandensis]|uniref:Uncharacterized enzyme of heme biosynthesis n=1 Tax=Reinekea blandensis MED297 TaxID=314283 RepID=A4BAQ0_9GAMM|nr:uroporphyrinogen-III C-methyltransferase [Reinekea blandensis]EAR11006.1 uncharacterized enzyme of heme biosynthesis [Reinekea sp. MED297] [Reinekea blandensis MED297]